jgi:uncharacterized integral membrane protein
MTKFERSSNQTNKLPLSIAIILLAIAILLIILLIQNWQPAIVVYFLGQKSYAVPLSLTMLIALIGGGVVAMVINLLINPFKNIEQKERVAAKNNSQSQFEDEDFDDYADEFQDDFDDDYIEVKYTKK